jgi:hypothetical protein
MAGLWMWIELQNNLMGHRLFSLDLNPSHRRPIGPITEPTKTRRNGVVLVSLPLTNPTWRGASRENEESREREREREMSLTSTAGYVARRAAQKERVRILYRQALKDKLNWAVHRHIFYQDVLTHHHDRHSSQSIPFPIRSRWNLSTPHFWPFQFVIFLCFRLQSSASVLTPTNTWFVLFKFLLLFVCT